MYIVNELTSHGFVLRLERTDRHDGWGQDLIVAWITAPIIGYQLHRVHEVGSMYDTLPYPTLADHIPFV